MSRLREAQDRELTPGIFTISMLNGRSEIGRYLNCLRGMARAPALRRLVSKRLLQFPLIAKLFAS
jgi:hypothetical protein